MVSVTGVWASSRPGRRVEVGVGVKARAECDSVSGQGLEAGAVRQTMWEAEKIQSGSPSWVLGLGRCAHQCRSARLSASLGEAAGHPFARACMMGFAVLRSTGSIRMARPRRCRSHRLGERRCGGHDLHDLASTSSWGGGHEATAAGGAVGRGSSPRTWWSRSA
jgi:hypothetical protein